MEASFPSGKHFFSPWAADATKRGLFFSRNSRRWSKKYYGLDGHVIKKDILIGIIITVIIFLVVGIVMYFSK